MDMEEQALQAFRDTLNKMAWLNEMAMKDALKGWKPSEVHCIEYVGKHPQTNVTRLADAFYMTRGAISKLTKKLVEKGCLESYQRPENKKEVHFTLTAQGQRIFDAHEALHRRFQARDQAVFAQVTARQFEEMLAFTQLYSAHLDAEIAKLHPGERPEEA